MIKYYFKTELYNAKPTHSFQVTNSKNIQSNTAKSTPNKSSSQAFKSKNRSSSISKSSDTFKVKYKTSFRNISKCQGNNNVKSDKFEHLLIMKRQRNSYMVEEKYKAIKLARRTSNTFAAQTYSLDLTMLCWWVKNFSQGNLSNKNSRRYNLSLCRKTNIAQKLPEDLENKLLQFQRFVIRLRQKNNYPLGKVWPAHTPPPPAGIVVWFQDKGWIANGDDISHDIIIRSFKKYGISNYLSGSKDHLIYENDGENLENAKSVNNSNESEINSEYESANENANNNYNSVDKDTNTENDSNN
ncbi:17845_t:CDS:2 [Dentiscutata erythropus]|uniref:17845_t:CDS:1 n=1 Tax=Dentiscutata erythropus TaxID=1348616 RepID=A0A9N9A173_9GLOM|nr:17845_t:CDS:2 [Dentiscutata erythropus]